MKLPALLLFILVPVVTAQVHGAELTVPGIEKLLASVDAAIAARKLSAVDAYLADDVDISVNLTSNGQLQFASPSKREYLALLHQIWSRASAYEYQRQNQQIELQGKQAIVTADVSESVTLNGQVMITASREMTVIERVNGKLVATAISITSHD